MYSDDFTIKGPREKITKWHVELYPRGKIGDALEYVSVFLQNKTAEEVVANCVVSTLDANMVKQKIFENLTKFRRQGIMGSNKGGVYIKKTSTFFLDYTLFLLVLKSVSSKRVIWR